MLNRRFLNGFTLIELVTVVGIIGILMLLAAPEFRAWMANGQVRSTAEALQNDIRIAQAEALRRNRQVALVLTNGTPNQAAPTFTAATSARNWAIVALPLAGEGNNTTSSDGSTLTGFISSNIQQASNTAMITGSVRAICFNSMGRLTASAAIANAGGEQCQTPTTTDPRTFDISSPNANRALRLQVRLGGQVRLCDPYKSSPAPDAC